MFNTKEREKTTAPTVKDLDAQVRLAAEKLTEAAQPKPLSKVAGMESDVALLRSMKDRWASIDGRLVVYNLEDVIRNMESYIKFAKAVR